MTEDKLYTFSGTIKSFDKNTGIGIVSVNSNEAVDIEDCVFDIKHYYLEDPLIKNLPEVNELVEVTFSGFVGRKLIDIRSRVKPQKYGIVVTASVENVNAGEVLKLYHDGYTQSEIAKMLNVRQRTITAVFKKDTLFNKSKKE